MGSRELILHVENDEDDVFMLKRAFEKAGITHPLRTAANGKRAIAYLNGEEDYANRTEFPLPTIILLDWNMPLMSGKEFLVWLRSNPRWKRLPVVVLTSSDAPRDMLEAYDAGANGFLVKPNSHLDFLAMSRTFAQYWLDLNRTEFRKSFSV